VTRIIEAKPFDASFQVDMGVLIKAIELLATHAPLGEASDLAGLPAKLPTSGVDEKALLSDLSKLVLQGGFDLGGPVSFAHMDPPTPWLTWVMTLWNARLNQNLLHPATSPSARIIEERVVSWLAPYFGMAGGHMVPGSTIANLTALWAARDVRGVTEIVASDTAHVSIEKSARILGLPFRRLPTDETGRLIADSVKNVENACLVLVAGTTSTGAVDLLSLAGQAAWTHVDAAWAGPLRLSDQYTSRLDGIEAADSVAVSAHKWLFQPKESALIFFRDTQAANAALSFGGAYLAAPNIGLLGSHGAAAVPLLAMLMAWGKEGLADRLDRCMAAAARFASFVRNEERLELLGEPHTGVVVWRPRDIEIDNFYASLPSGLASQTSIGGSRWLRCVAANPNLDIDAIVAAVRETISRVD
jgi:L-2,4-diaminobutyrate decarboxylase